MPRQRAFLIGQASVDGALVMCHTPRVGIAPLPPADPFPPSFLTCSCPTRPVINFNLILFFPSWYSQVFGSVFLPFFSRLPVGLPTRCAESVGKDSFLFRPPLALSLVPPSSLSLFFASCLWISWTSHSLSARVLLPGCLRGC